MNPAATAAAQDLRTIAVSWPDLRDALGAPTQHSWPPVQLRGLLAAQRDLDPEETEAQHWQAKARRALERDPAQLGERPILIQARIFETMGAVRQDLLDCADAVAGQVQQQPLAELRGGDWPEAYRARHNLRAIKDRADPRRWRWTGQRPDGGYTALWLLGRVQGAPGPFDRLTTRELDQVAAVARHAAHRVEQALDLADGRAKLERPCGECGKPIQIHGGAGARPTARCTGCGRIWSLTETAA